MRKLMARRLVLLTVAVCFGHSAALPAHLGSAAPAGPGHAPLMRLSGGLDTPGKSTTACTRQAGIPGVFHARIGLQSMAAKGSRQPADGEKIGINIMATCVALIASSAIGGSFLALPMATRPMGFFPAATCMTVCWFYLFLQGMVVAELSLRAMAITGRKVVSIYTIADLTGGSSLARALGSMWLLLQYSCLVAQVSRGGDLLARSPLGLSHATSCGLITLCFHTLVFGLAGQRRAGWLAESVNNCMTAAFLVAMCVLIYLGIGHEAKLDRLLRGDWRPVTFLSMAPLMLQIMMFIQTVPTVCAMLAGDRAKVQLVVLLGSLCPLLVCLVWSAVGLAMVPENIARHNADPIDFLLHKRQGSGSSLITNAAILVACTAIGTTIVGIYLIVAQYFDDLLGRKGSSSQCLQQSQLARKALPVPGQSMLSNLGDGERDPAMRAGGVIPADAKTASENREAYWWGDIITGRLFADRQGRGWQDRLLSASATILPPLFGALGGEQMYMLALRFAGNYPVTVIWGIMPPLLLSRMRAIPLPTATMIENGSHGDAHVRLLPQRMGLLLPLSLAAVILMSRTFLTDLSALLGAGSIKPLTPLQNLHETRSPTSGAQ